MPNISLFDIMIKNARFKLITSFADQETQDIFDGKKSKSAIKRLDPALWRIAQRKLHIIKSATRIDDLRIPPGNRLEMLCGDLKGYHSIRINNQYRIIFLWNGQDAQKTSCIT